MSRGWVELHRVARYDFLSGLTKRGKRMKLGFGEAKKIEERWDLLLGWATHFILFFILSPTDWAKEELETKESTQKMWSN